MDEPVKNIVIIHILGSEPNFPWKSNRNDEPVVYTEETEDVEEQGNKQAGVKFQIGVEEAEEEVDDGEEEHFKEKGHRHHHRHHKKSSKADRRTSQDFVMMADDSGHLQEADLEEIAGHRFEKSKGLSVPKFSHPKKSSGVFKIGKEDIAEIGKNSKVMSHMGYGYRTDCDHTPHALFIEMDELEGEEWEERAR